MPNTANPGGGAVRDSLFVEGVQDTDMVCMLVQSPEHGSGDFPGMPWTVTPWEWVPGS